MYCSAEATFGVLHSQALAERKKWAQLGSLARDKKATLPAAKVFKICQDHGAPHDLAELFASRISDPAKRIVAYDKLRMHDAALEMAREIRDLEVLREARRGLPLASPLAASLDSLIDR